MFFFVSLRRSRPARRPSICDETENKEVVVMLKNTSKVVTATVALRLKFTRQKNDSIGACLTLTITLIDIKILNAQRGYVSAGGRGNVTCPAEHSPPG